MDHLIGTEYTAVVGNLASASEWLGRGFGTPYRSHLNTSIEVMRLQHQSRFFEQKSPDSNNAPAQADPPTSAVYCIAGNIRTEIFSDKVEFRPFVRIIFSYSAAC